MELLDRWAEDRGGTRRVAQARLRQSIGKIDPKRDPPAKWSEAGLQRIFHTFAPPLSYPSRRHRVTDRVRSMTRQRRLRILPDSVEADDLRGRSRDYIEIGVWRGGALAYGREVLRQGAFGKRAGKSPLYRREPFLAFRLPICPTNR